MNYTKSEKAEALESMAKMLKPGDTVYTVLRHVSRSGMRREIGILVPVPADKQGNGAPIDFWHPNYSVAVLLDSPLNERRDGIKVDGCGMDMGFNTVYNLGRILFPDGFGCSGKGCGSNDHSNGDRDYTEHGHRGPRYDGTKDSLRHWHRDGGYALKNRWL